MPPLSAAGGPRRGRRGRVVDNSPEAVRRRRQRRKLILLISTGVAVAVLVAFGGFGLLLYRQATEPDRSTPALAVEQYINAMFDQRSPAQVALFTCGSSSRLQEMDQLLAQVKQIEVRYNISVSVRLGELNVPPVTSNTVPVAITLNVDVPETGGMISRSVQHWQIETRNESGWRVCAAHRTS